MKQIFGTELQLQEDQTFSTDGKTVLTPEELLKNKTEVAKTEVTSPTSAPNNTQESTAPAQQPESKPPASSEKPSDTTVNEDASAYVAKVYVLKSSFESKLNGLYNEAISYYNSVPSEQKKNAKGEIISRFYSRATALEADCDAQLNEILNDLSANLKANGGDTSLVSKIRQAYNNEKSLKKSYYLNLVK